MDMDMKMNGGPDGLGWADLEACTLPTAERPLRLVEFDDLFTTALRSIERNGDTRARMLLAGDGGLAERTQRLADAESSCCSFFTFGVTSLDESQVAFDVEVLPAYADVLAGLVARAEIALGAAS
jgi:hypothetical protein